MISSFAVKFFYRKEIVSKKQEIIEGITFITPSPFITFGFSTNLKSLLLANFLGTLHRGMFNIINRKAILEYCKKYPIAKLALLVWYQKMSKSGYLNFNELKDNFPTASLVGDYRVIFNIMGNKFRLIVRVVFVYKLVQVKWFGTHNEYDQIDPITIEKKH